MTGGTGRGGKILHKDGFGFTFNPEACKECPGRCCNGESGTVFVNTKEIEAISGYRGIDASQLIDQYLFKISYRFSIREVKRDDNYACIFFDVGKNRCSIYPVRPHQCRTFPFWSYFRGKPQEAARECPGIALCAVTPSAFEH